MGKYPSGEPVGRESNNGRETKITSYVRIIALEDTRITDHQVFNCILGSFDFFLIYMLAKLFLSGPIEGGCRTACRIKALPEMISTLYF